MMKYLRKYVILLATVFSTVLFSQAETEISFAISDNEEGSKTVIVGTDSSATDSIDTAFSESELPPPPPSGIFDARLILPNGIPSLVDIRDGRPNAGENIEYQLSWQLSEGASELNMAWTLPEGVELTIQDINGGSVINENFTSGEGSFTITDQSIREVNLLFKGDGIVGVNDEQLPAEYLLKQNYPNPFNPSTTIEFQLPVSSEVKIDLYNLLGQKVQSIADNSFTAGTHRVNFNAANLPSGVYVYSITANGKDQRNFISSRKMMLLK